jgi:hypothetical protein
VPALFWTGLLHAVCLVGGYSLAPAVLVIVAAGVFGFSAFVSYVFTLRVN